MTKKHVIWFTVVAVLAAAVLVAAHLMLPIGKSWPVNRLLHHAWEGLAAAGVIGGIVWLMWPRRKARRRDEQRQEAHRRALCLGALVLAAALLVVFAEMHREISSDRRLEGQALDDLRAIGQALDSYAADHEGAQPASLVDLTPKYLPAARLYYVHREGPGRAEPPASPEPATPEALSYALPEQTVAPDASKQVPPRVRAYLRPGNAWAPLTAVLERDRPARVVGEDEVRGYETQFEKPE